MRILRMIYDVGAGDLIGCPYKACPVSKSQQLIVASQIREL